MIPAQDLELLRSFSSQAEVAVSAYLCLDTAERRESAYEQFLDQIHLRLAQCDPNSECREALKEDIEIVGLYLRTNGHRQHNGLAIFSCASELFWLAYPLAVSVPIQVAVGRRFNLEPLAHASALGDA